MQYHHFDVTNKATNARTNMLSERGATRADARKKAMRKFNMIYGPEKRALFNVED